MAGISTRTGGGKFVTFYRDGQRKIVNLGQIDNRKANVIAGHIEELVSAAAGNTAIKPATAAWLKGIDAKLAEKLVNSGLILPRQRPVAVTLEKFLTSYIDGRAKLKAGTRTNLEQAKSRLVAFFKPDKPIAEITSGDADDWREWLKNDLAENTIRRCCGRARQFFKYAVKHKLIDQNPFTEMKDIQVKSNGSRVYFVTQDDAYKVLAACPDTQWRLVFALARFGGLRCPSEHALLRWADVDWVNNSFVVYSPKTEHHEGHDKRVVPIFPELRPYLEAARKEASQDTEFVITLPAVVRHRSNGRASNLGTQLVRFIKRAGLKPWPKLFQNLRSSRQTELTKQYPAHVVCQWIGNSEIVAKEHYLQVTQDDFTNAASTGCAHPKAHPFVSQQGMEKTDDWEGLLQECAAKATQNGKLEQFMASLGNAMKSQQAPRGCLNSIHVL